MGIVSFTNVPFYIDYVNSTFSSFVKQTTFGDNDSPQVFKTVFIYCWSKPEVEEVLSM